MARPKTGNPRKQHYRRNPAWSSEMTTLSNQVAQLIRENHMYFPRTIEWGSQVNTTGIIQGVMILAAEHIKTITNDQWLKAIQTFSEYIFVGEHRGIHLDPQSLDAFHIIGETLKAIQRPSDVKLTWRGEYHYPLIISVSLQWFVDTYS